MRPSTITGPTPRFFNRARRFVWCRPRELSCVHGHRLKLQPFAIGVVGITCTYKAPPGDAIACGVAVAYIPFPEYRATLALEADVSELTALLVSGKSRGEAMEYLGVELPEEYRPAA